jgi:hypothetical protein
MSKRPSSSLGKQRTGEEVWAPIQGDTRDSGGDSDDDEDAMSCDVDAEPFSFSSELLEQSAF